MILIVGPIGSGKDTSSSYLSNKYGFHVISMSDLVRSEAKQMSLPTDRLTLQKIKMERCKEFSMAYWASEALKKVSTRTEVICGIRFLEELDYFKRRFPTCFVLAINASSERRADRMVKRGREGDPDSIASFERQDKTDNELFEINKLMRLSDGVITNDGSIFDLQEKLDLLISILKNRTIVSEN